MVESRNGLEWRAFLRTPGNAWKWDGERAGKPLFAFLRQKGNRQIVGKEARRAEKARHSSENVKRRQGLRASGVHFAAPGET